MRPWDRALRGVGRLNESPALASAARAPAQRAKRRAKAPLSTSRHPSPMSSAGRRSNGKRRVHFGPVAAFHSSQVYTLSTYAMPPWRSMMRSGSARAARERAACSVRPCRAAARRRNCGTAANAPGRRACFGAHGQVVQRQGRGRRRSRHGVRRGARTEGGAAWEAWWWDSRFRDAIREDIDRYWTRRAASLVRRHTNAMTRPVAARARRRSQPLVVAEALTRRGGGKLRFQPRAGAAGRLLEHPERHRHAHLARRRASRARVSAGRRGRCAQSCSLAPGWRRPPCSSAPRWPARAGCAARASAPPRRA